MLIQTKDGLIGISNQVISTIAGKAATECFGVKGMAVTLKDGITHLLKGELLSRGVKVSADQDGKLSVELHIAVDSGLNIREITRSIISEVSYRLKQDAGIEDAQITVCVDWIKG